MKGKLIKVLEHYHLYDGDKAIATTIDCNPMQLPSLSLKNCEAIANGYDLDELAVEDCIVYPEHYNAVVKHYKRGFQKALKILGDKKFSEEDVKKAILLSMKYNDVGVIQTLQQTEWDVEIVMICPHPEDTYVCGMQYGCDGDGCNHPNQIPYLDKNGCLILKRNYERV